MSRLPVMPCSPHKAGDNSGYEGGGAAEPSQREPTVGQADEEYGLCTAQQLHKHEHVRRGLNILFGTAFPHEGCPSGSFGPNARPVGIIYSPSSSLPQYFL